MEPDQMARSILDKIAFYGLSCYFLLMQLTALHWSKCSWGKNYKISKYNLTDLVFQGGPILYRN